MSLLMDGEVWSIKTMADCSPDWSIINNPTTNGMGQLINVTSELGGVGNENFVTAAPEVEPGPI